MYSVYEELTYLVNQGYLLHGSQQKLIYISPQKKDNLPTAGGRIKAVYATDSVDVAMFKATISAKKLPKIAGKRGGVISWGFSDDDKPKFLITPNYVAHKAFSRGYVYVLHPEDFIILKKLPHEYYSRSKVTPIAVTKIKPNSFLRRHQLIIWPKEELERRKRYSEKELTQMGYT